MVALGRSMTSHAGSTCTRCDDMDGTSAAESEHALKSVSSVVELEKEGRSISSHASAFSALASSAAVVRAPTSLQSDSAAQSKHSLIKPSPSGSGEIVPFTSNAHNDRTHVRTPAARQPTRIVHVSARERTNNSAGSSSTVSTTAPRQSSSNEGVTTRHKAVGRERV